jgi:hypothetical protein
LVFLGVFMVFCGSFMLFHAYSCFFMRFINGFLWNFVAF